MKKVKTPLRGKVKTRSSVPSPMPVGKAFAKTDKSMPKVNTQDVRHGKYDLPMFIKPQKRGPKKRV